MMNCNSTLTLLSFTILISLLACNQPNTHTDQASANPLFQLLDPAQTGVDFANLVKEDTTFNILNYLYFYNGGGVSIGDINNDGLPDIYLTANRLPNKLYLNKGNLKFEDITEKAGVAGNIGWTTGTTMADVNGDGWLDIYVCNVSNLLGLSGHNQLFINNQNGTFSEKAKEYGLDFSGFSTQAAFFDYDNDGDLDCYLLNHSTHYEGTYRRAAEIRPEKNERAGDRLMKNENGKFMDVSEKAGIYSSAVGYGLGIAIGDINQDGWQDIYIANDFHENDYLYLNNGNGTFTESIRQVIGHTSKFSMGVDMADFNNDGRLDVFSADMMPENEQIRKASEESADAYSIYQFKYSFGYYHQFAKNALQVNSLISKEKSLTNFRLLEIAQLAGVATTDWSWSVLFADLDNDGWKDLFVANGIPRRPNDMDYLKFVSDPNIRYPLLQGIDEAKLKYTEQMPIIKIPNFAFKNNKNLTFNNLSKEWGLDKAGFSNGTAYADLDDDGDLDLVVNNFNENASIYENQNIDKNNYLKIKLVGEIQNTSGIGAKLILKLKNQIIYQEQSPTRGFQSSVDHVLTIGLGKNEMIDSLIVAWNNGNSQLLTNVKANQFLTLKQSEASEKNSFNQYNSWLSSHQLFADITNQINIPFTHEENAITDFEREFLIPYALSTQGSKIAKGDVNSDGLEDIFVPNGKWKTSALLIQQKNSSFALSQKSLFEQDSICEDVSAAFFDADGDKDLDLIVVSAGNEFFGKDKQIQPRLYLNDGKGNFSKTENQLPEIFVNASCVKPADFDGDGDIDLFIGARVEARKFGIDPPSFILKNNGKGIFENASAEVLGNNLLGMVTDAVWVDFDNDQHIDLVVVGEWMPITFLKNQNNKLINLTTHNQHLTSNSGFWNSLLADDFDGDGDIDFVAGNWGQNSYLKPTENEPITLFVNDFDANGSTDPIICMYRAASDGSRQLFPLASKDEMTSQLPHLRKKFLKYKDYSTATIHDIFTPEELKGAVVKYAQNFSTSYIENKGKEGFAIRSLPIEAQFSTVFALQAGDFDKDGKKDLLLGGNFYGVTPLLSRYDASVGLLLKGDGKGNFLPIAPAQSGLVINGECRDIQFVTLANGKKVALVMRNNDKLQVLEILSKTL
jgi:hypothetical protein